MRVCQSTTGLQTLAKRLPAPSPTGYRPRHDGTKPRGVEQAKFGSERLLTIAS